MKPSHNRLKAHSLLLSLISVIILATAGLTVFSQPGPVKASSTLIFTPVADSYVSETEPDKNFGHNRSIRMDGSPLVRGYLRFDITGLDGPVTKVTLRIFANSSSASDFEVNKVADNSWQEKEITFNNAPAPGDEVGKSNGFSSDTWVQVDVTPLLDANGAVSIALVGIDQAAINLASRDYRGNQPQLLVDTSSATTPTATHTEGPSATPTRTKQPSATVTTTVLPIITASITTQPTATATNPPNPSPTPPGEYQPAFPIRAVFYYPWFPEAWNQQGYNPFTNYTPSLGFYDSSSLTVIRTHINAMTYGNISMGILSWWG